MRGSHLFSLVAVMLCAGLGTALAVSPGFASAQVGDADLVLARSSVFGGLVPALIVLVIAGLVTWAMMKSIGLLAGAFVFVAAVVLSPGFALAQATLDAGPAAVALIEWLSPILLVIFMGGVSWLTYKLTGLLGLKVNALQRAVVEQGLERAIGYAISKVGDKAAGGIPITVKNEALALAAGYALNAIPGALRHFRKTPSDIADMIEARLGDVLVDPKVERSQIYPTIGQSTAG